MDNVEKRIILSSQSYITHNGPFKINDNEIAQPSKFGIGNRKWGSNDPYIIWPKYNKPWTISLEDSDCRYVRIKHIDNTNYHEINEGSIITLLSKEFDIDNKPFYKWEVIDNESLTINKGSKVFNESKMLYDFCYNKKINPLLLIKFIDYYSFHMGIMHNGKRSFDINIGKDMRAHLYTLFNKDIVNELYDLIVCIIFNIYELAKTINKKENMNNTYYIIKSLLFELINLDNYKL